MSSSSAPTAAQTVELLLLLLLSVLLVMCADLGQVFYCCLHVVQLIEEGVFAICDPSLVHGLVILLIPDRRTDSIISMPMMLVLIRACKLLGRAHFLRMASVRCCRSYRLIAPAADQAPAALLLYQA